MNTKTISKDAASFDNPADQLDAQWSKPMKLKTSGTRIGQMIGVGLFALLWNGLISLVYFTVQFDNFGWRELCVVLPFVLIGLALIYTTFCSVFAIFNPTVEIALSSGAVPLGGQIDVAWQLEGRFERIKKLTIEVVASQYTTSVYGSKTVVVSQHATYGHRSKTVIHKKILEKLPIIETMELTDVAFGSATVTIPVDSMHSSEEKRNKIKWRVVVQGEIPWFPNIYEEFEFRVTPSQAPARSSLELYDQCASSELTADRSVSN